LVCNPLYGSGLLTRFHFVFDYVQANFWNTMSRIVPVFGGFNFKVELTSVNGGSRVVAGFRSKDEAIAWLASRDPEEASPATHQRVVSPGDRPDDPSRAIDCDDIACNGCLA
jgi:hypothetical protein